MATIRHHIRIARSADDVWKVVSDAGAIATWAPGMESSRLDGNVRTVVLGGGIELQEEVVTADDELRRFQYRIVGGPLTLDYHLATVDVIADEGGDGSLVVYGTDVLPDDAKALIDPALAAAVKGLRAHLEA